MTVSAVTGAGGRVSREGGTGFRLAAVGCGPESVVAGAGARLSELQAANNRENARKRFSFFIQAIFTALIETL